MADSLAECRRYFLRVAKLPEDTPDPDDFVGRAAAVLDCVFAGLHHALDEIARAKVYQGRTGPYMIEIKTFSTFATFDFRELTYLVFAGHHYGIRVEISHCSNRSLSIRLSPRKREGGLAQRHPTIGQAVAQWRESYPEDTEWRETPKEEGTP